MSNQLSTMEPSVGTPQRFSLFSRESSIKVAHFMAKHRFTIPREGAARRRLFDGPEKTIVKKSQQAIELPPDVELASRMLYNLKLKERQEYTETNVLASLVLSTHVEFPDRCIYISAVNWEECQRQRSPGCAFCSRHQSNLIGRRTQSF